MTLSIKLCSSINQLNSKQWNTMVRNGYPFLQHGLLNAMEQHHCLGEHVGWIPQYLACFQHEKLTGALPLYEKQNSWGEFVFDHLWANAYQRHGLNYYPKLINAIPFTPATGQRILALDNTSIVMLLKAAQTLARDRGYSGIHYLFPDKKDSQDIKQTNVLQRIDCQYHWHNKNYSSFDDFLHALKAKKRKNIKQERKRVIDQGIKIKHYDGHTANPEHWHKFTQLYQSVYDRKYGMPAFNCDFFKKIAGIIPEQILLFFAYCQNEIVATSLMYRDQDTLYGRHWGCDGYLDCLHFELCYYQGIEYCIEQGLKKFDPGAQGEHKIARGFIPMQTQSFHWLCDSPFNHAIKRFVDVEKTNVKNYIEMINTHSPYRSDTTFNQTYLNKLHIKN